MSQSPDRSGHHPQHSHGSGTTNTRRLAIVLALVLVYMVVEVVGGLIADPSR